MADWIAVVEAEPRRREALFRRAVSAFGRLRDHTPCEEVARGGVSLALYAALAGQHPWVDRRAEPQGPTAVIAGAWVPLESVAEDLRGQLARALTRNGSHDLPIDGVFAALAVHGDGSLTVATDRIGSLHVYWTRVGDGFAISTSPTVLAVLRDANWDRVGVAEFLGLGTVYEHRSLHAGVSKVGPATLARFAPGRGTPETHAYWRVHDHTWNGTAPDPEAAHRLFEELQGAVTRVASRYPRPMFDLTGGYDSRVLFAAAHKSGVPLATVVNGVVDSGDVYSANTIARAYGVDHRHQSLPEDWGTEWWDLAQRAVGLVDGEYNALEYARTLYFQGRVARDFDTTVNGSGGELCRGYWWELLYPGVGKPSSFDAARVAAKRYAFSEGAMALLAEPALEGGIVAHVAGIMDRANLPFTQLPNTAAMDNVYLTLRMQRWQGRLASATNRIWPCLAPFLMRGPMQAAIAAHPNLRIRSRMASDILELADRRLADLPMADGFPAARMRLGNLHRFTPLASYYLGKVYDKTMGRVVPRPRGGSEANALLVSVAQSDAVRECLRPESMATREMYDPSRLAVFVDAERRSPSEERLGRVLTLELLARKMSAMRQSAAGMP